MLFEAAPESLALGRIIEVAAVANHDKVEAGHHQQDLIAGAGPCKGITRNLAPDAVEIGVPSEATSGLRITWQSRWFWCLGILQDCLDPASADELFALPVAFSQHQSTDAGDSSCSVRAAAPVGHEIQAIHFVRLAVTDGPLAVVYPDRLHDAFA